MAHEVESLLLVKDGAWHGLGNIVQDAPTWEETFKLAGLDWQIREVPLCARLFDDSGEVVEITTHKALYRDTDNKFLGVVGVGYGVVQLKPAFSALKPLIESGMLEVDSAGCLREGKRVFFNCKISGLAAEVIPGDRMEAYILQAMGTDGGMDHTTIQTGRRTVCMNTLNMNLRDAESGKLKSFKFRHTKNIGEKLETLRDQFARIADDFKFALETYRYLAHKPIQQNQLEPFYAKALGLKRASNGQYLAAGPAKETNTRGEMLLGYNPDNLEQSDMNEGKRQIEALLNSYESGKGQDLPGVKGTYWGAVNGLTHWVDHTRGRTPESRFEAAQFGEGARIRNRAIALAVAA